MIRRPKRHDKVGRSMICWYCNKIAETDHDYDPRTASYDIGSESPRCARHWRYTCSLCGTPHHFHATFYCAKIGGFVCASCSKESREVLRSFWAWEYYWEYRCPSCDDWHPSLDLLEYDGKHPYQERPEWERSRLGLSEEIFIDRSRASRPTAVLKEVEAITDEEVSRSWDLKAEDWDRGYDERGDRNRRYQSDPVLFKLLGEVEGKTILDAGSGNGYLCRLLAKRGARMVGVELSKRLHELAASYEEREHLGITYHNGTISSMPYLKDGSFDAIVSNYVLMDCRDYEGAISEFARVLKPGGIATIVISHPCFGTMPASGGVMVPPDTQRREERVGWLVDEYFIKCSFEQVWGGFESPFLTFHRTLTDYYKTFQRNGLDLVDMEEPSISEEGRKALPPHRVRRALRIPWSIAFKLMIAKD